MSDLNLHNAKCFCTDAFVKSNKKFCHVLFCVHSKLKEKVFKRDEVHRIDKVFNYLNL